MKLLLVLLPLLLQEPMRAADLVSLDVLRPLVAEGIALVEKQTGRPFPKKPLLDIAPAKVVEKICTDEFRPQIPVLMPGATPEDMESALKVAAEAFASRVFAKYAFATNTLHFVPENFDKFAKGLKSERILTKSFLKTVVIHELVHSHDNQLYDLGKCIAGAKTAEEIEVMNALLEGHAQYVTAAIVHGTPLEEDFVEMERAVLNPPASSEAERLLNAQMNVTSTFAYGRGRAFFDALAKSGRPKFVDDVFARPPSGKSVILHPETYYTPAAARRAPTDLTSLFDGLKKDLERPEWKSNVVPVDEMSYRTACSDFVPKKDLDEAMAGYLGGRTLILGLPDLSRMINVVILEYADVAAARKGRELNLGVAKSKDARMKEGHIRIVSADYAAQKSEKVEGALVVTKEIAVGEQKAMLRDGMGSVRTFVMEIVFSNEPIEPKALLELMEKVAGLLPAK